MVIIKSRGEAWKRWNSKIHKCVQRSYAERNYNDDYDELLTNSL